LIWALTAAGAILGILLGWLLRGDRPAGDSPKDWMTRLASRDEDLRAAQQELADTVLELQELQAAAGRKGDEPDDALPEELTQARKTMLELGRDLESARRALTRHGEPTGNPLIESLEAEPGREAAGNPATTRRPSVDV
jgi:hypothetical protein